MMLLAARPGASAGLRASTIAASAAERFSFRFSVPPSPKPAMNSLNLSGEDRWVRLVSDLSEPSPLMLRTSLHSSHGAPGRAMGTTVSSGALKSFTPWLCWPCDRCSAMSGPLFFEPDGGIEPHAALGRFVPVQRVLRVVGVVVDDARLDAMPADLRLGQDLFEVLAHGIPDPLDRGVVPPDVDLDERVAHARGRAGQGPEPAARDPVVRQVRLRAVLRHFLPRVDPAARVRRDRGPGGQPGGEQVLDHRGAVCHLTPPSVGFHHRPGTAGTPPAGGPGGWRSPAAGCVPAAAA